MTSLPMILQFLHEALEGGAPLQFTRTRTISSVLVNAVTLCTSTDIHETTRTDTSNTLTKHSNLPRHGTCPHWSLKSARAIFVVHYWESVPRRQHNYFVFKARISEITPMCHIFSHHLLRLLPTASIAFFASSAILISFFVSSKRVAPYAPCLKSERMDATRA